jgi:ribonuclease VapC
MTFFIDASVIVSILTLEEDAAVFSARVGKAKGATTSPIAVFEATQAVARKSDGDLEAASEDVIAFLDQMGCVVTPIIPTDGEAALRAQGLFGKGRHPAALNMGDCFAYACAKRLGVPLLYKGDDFAKTDIRSALEP